MKQDSILWDVIFVLEADNMHLNYEDGQWDAEHCLYPHAFLRHYGGEGNSAMYVIVNQRPLGASYATHDGQTQVRSVSGTMSCQARLEGSRFCKQMLERCDERQKFESDIHIQMCIYIYA